VPDAVQAQLVERDALPERELDALPAAAARQDEQVEAPGGSPVPASPAAAEQDGSQATGGFQVPDGSPV
jgi:hypothetical protein